MSESLQADLESDAPLLQDGASAAGAEGAALTGEQGTLRKITRSNTQKYAHNSKGSQCLGKA